MCSRYNQFKVAENWLEENQKKLVKFEEPNEKGCEYFSHPSSQKKVECNFYSCFPIFNEL